MPIPVESTNIKTVDFNESSGVFTVEFHTGKRYEYSGMTPEVYKAFMDSPSKGGYFSKNIRNVLPSKGLE